MENISTLAEIFGNGFFPIIMCVVILVGAFYLFKFLFGQFKTLLENITSSHAQENEKLSQVIENNTSVITTMVNRLEKVEYKLTDVEDKVEDLIRKELS